MQKIKAITKNLLDPRLTPYLLVTSIITTSLTRDQYHIGLFLLSLASVHAFANLLTQKQKLTPLLLLTVLATFLYIAASLRAKNFLESFIYPESPFFYLLVISLYLQSSDRQPQLKHLVTYIIILASLTVTNELIIQTILRLRPLPLTPLTFLGSPIDQIFILTITSLTVYFLLPKKRWLIAPLLILSLIALSKVRYYDLGLGFNQTYIYLIDELKTPTRLLLGHSPSRFTSFFGIHFAGIEDEIQKIPDHSQSLLLTLISTIGILGTSAILAIYVYIYLKITNDIDIDKNISKYIKILYPATALTALLLPLGANSITLFHIISLYLTRYIKASQIALPTFTPPHIPHFSKIIAIFRIIAISPLLFLVFWQFRSTLADYKLARYNAEAKKSQSLYAYNTIREAITLYPYRADLHTQYSLVNLILADKLSSEGISSEQDQSNILGLYQQAIREAGTATTLEPQNYQYWKNLGVIYRELISVAPNSYSFAEAAYTTALKIAPQNPSLWLDLGVVYYKSSQYQRACDVTNKALELKPDWYQPHANLGLCYNKLGDATQAKTHLEAALSLTKPNTAEYQKISEDLKQFN